MKNTLPIQARPDKHVMGPPLIPYVKQKVPPDLLNGAFSEIQVTGSARLGNPAARIDDAYEPLDSRRPKMSAISSRVARLECFPSRDLVYHYAGLVATALALGGCDPNVVRMSLPDPAQTRYVYLSSNLQSLGPVDVVIFGHVEKLKDLARGQWEGQGESEYDIFRWNKFVTDKGQTVALLGCLERTWGDAGYDLIHTLKKLSDIKCILYVAKAGALGSKHKPNRGIATGNQAFLGNEVITWKSPLDVILDDSEELNMSQLISHGPIVTVDTTLGETHEWLSEWKPRAEWVDCEVGYIAKAASELDVEFSYLDIISDNLNVIGGEDLSNEDTITVEKKRDVLYEQITRIIDLFISK